VEGDGRGKMGVKRLAWKERKKERKIGMDMDMMEYLFLKYFSYSPRKSSVSLCSFFLDSIPAKLRSIISVYSIFFCAAQVHSPYSPEYVILIHRVV